MKPLSVLCWVGALVAFWVVVIVAGVPTLPLMLAYGVVGALALLTQVKPRRRRHRSRPLFQHADFV